MTPAIKRTRFLKVVPWDSTGSLPSERNQSQKGKGGLEIAIIATTPTSTATTIKAFRRLHNPPSCCLTVMTNPRSPGNTGPPRPGRPPGAQCIWPACVNFSSGPRSSGRQFDPALDQVLGVALAVAALVMPTAYHHPAPGWPSLAFCLWSELRLFLASIGLAPW